MKRLVIWFASIIVAGCNGTTGSGLVSFSAVVGGPEGVVAGAPFSFTSGSGYDITLTEARFHLGAVYFNQSVPTSGGPQEPCILPGVYVDQVFGGCSGSGGCGVDVDLLSPQLVPFATPGSGTLNQAVTAEVWLTGGDINATDDETPILQVAGTAAKDGHSWPFSAVVTIGANHTAASQNPAMPGVNPVCRQRIVSPIELLDPVTGSAGPTIANGGTLTVRVDPTHMFDSVAFTALAPTGSTTTLTIPDDASLVGEQLFNGVRSTIPRPRAGQADLRVYQFDVSNPR